MREDDYEKETKVPIMYLEYFRVGNYVILNTMGNIITVYVYLP